MFTIVVDSNCDLPADYIAEHGIEVLPMPFELDNRAHDQGYWQEISGRDFYGALRRGGLARTSQIGPDSFAAAFTQYAKHGREVIVLLLSGGLSSTCNSARIALEEVRETYPGCKIHIVDAINASVGHGLLAMLAVNKRREGLSGADTAAWLEEKKHSVFGLFTVDDLMYLHRGGRLSRFSAIAGSALGIKPVLNFAPEGTLALKDKARSRKAALKLLAAQLQRSLAPGAMPDTVLIAHSDCEEDARTLAGMVKDAVQAREVAVMLMGPIIGTHVGPGAVAMVFEAGMTRNEYEDKFYS